jgi:hypothetical protein
LTLFLLPPLNQILLTSSLGVFYWSDREDYDVAYVGDWKDDARTGRGTCYWKSEDSYSGEWLDDRASGEGTKREKGGKRILLLEAQWLLTEQGEEADKGRRKVGGRRRRERAELCSWSLKKLRNIYLGFRKSVHGWMERREAGRERLF